MVIFFVYLVGWVIAARLLAVHWEPPLRVSETRADKAFLSMLAAFFWPFVLVVVPLVGVGWLLTWRVK